MAKSYNIILSEILTDMNNTPVQRPDGTHTTPSTIKGSMYYVIAAALAACVWGLYQARDWALRQMFAVTATRPFLERHAINIGLTPLPGESKQNLLNRYLIKRRQPVVVDNPDQYRLWAMSVEGVKNAWVWPQDYGIGTLTIDIISTDASEVPSEALINAVYAAVTNPALASAWSGRVYVRAPVFIRSDVAIVCATDNPAILADAVGSYLGNMDIAATLTKNAIAAVLYANGVIEHATVFTLNGVAVDSVPAVKHELIRPGTISINGVLYG